MHLNNKRILVTGADGFIGSHLIELLIEHGANVKALANYNSFNSWGWIEDVCCLNELEIISGDIRDYNLCKKMLKGIDIVFHLAALIAIPYSYTAPESYIETNIKGTFNVCKAAIECGIEKLIHTSTSEVYGTAKYVPIDENHPLQPQSPYSASKIGADAIAESFSHSFNLPLTIARPFNTYGPRQSARAVIPSIIIQIAKGKKSLKIGNLQPTRDFSYVEDTCRGLILLVQHDKTIGKTVNIGSNNEISIKDTFKIIKEKMNSDIKLEKDPERFRPENSEVDRLWCDNTKLKNLTGFESKYSIQLGLDKTIEWFSKPENIRKYKADIYNV